MPLLTPHAPPALSPPSTGVADSLSSRRAALRVSRALRLSKTKVAQGLKALQVCVGARLYMRVCVSACEPEQCM